MYLYREWDGGEGMKHSYWIPTNRLIERCLSSYCKEVQYCQNKYKIEIPMYIIDSGNIEIENSNRTAISAVKKKYDDVKITHISFEKQRDLIESILDDSELSKVWIEYFMNTRANYGAVMNRIYVLATALGYDVIHRRDSDTLLQNNCPYPLELEIEYITTSVSGGNSQVRVVGSGYIGEWNLDIKDLIRYDASKFNIFLDCLNISKDNQEEYITTTYTDSEKEFKSDDILINKKTPEAGNFCIYKLFKQYPCMPANNTLGTDYFTFKMAKALGWDILFHERRVVHEYHAERKNEEKKDNYFRSLLKLCDHSPVYWSLFNEFKKIKLSINPDDENVANVISDILEKAKYAYLDKRKENYDKFVNELLSPMFEAEADKLKKIKTDLLEECISDYDNHILLIRDWHTIINNAEKKQCILV